MASPPSPNSGPPAQGNTAQGNTAQGNTAQGNTAQGGPAPAAPAKPATATAAKAGPVIPKPAAPAAQASAQQTSAQPAAVAETTAPRRSLAGGLLKQTPAWAVSMLVHVIVLLSMALVVNPVPKPEAARMIIASAPEVDENFEEFEDVVEDQPVVPDQETAEFMTLPADSQVREVEVVTQTDELDAAQTSAELTDISLDVAASTDLLSTVGTVGGTAAGLSGRSSSVIRADMMRSGMKGIYTAELAKQIDTDAEESIHWLWDHQMPDGGWSFDCSKNPSCQGQCDNPKNKHHLNDRVAATALALWPSLMKGYIHGGARPKTKLDHRPKIEMGLAFLARNVIEGKGKAYHQGGGGDMYSQALTAAVLSEGYAMSQDKRLQVPAQMAIDFIMAAQDPSGGGWGYTPKRPGDTSIVAWQIVAMKSANMSFLRVNPLTIKKAVLFLDFVQSDGGAAYGYSDPASAGPTLTGAGLLCRIFMGWKQDNEALLRGAKSLAKRGPTSDMYYTYYATQVLYHLQNRLPEEWNAWQTALIPMLHKAQVTEGHQKGSYFKGLDGGAGADVGGRLYITSMATMTLEVYFKLGVIYSKVAADDFVE